MVLFGPARTKVKRDKIQVKVIITQEQLQISALSKPAFIKLINSSSELFFSVGKL